jgi:lipoyl(octanoyl) transferase
MHTTIFSDLGLIEYRKACDLQEKLFEQVYQTKLKRLVDTNLNSLNFLLFCEHPHVYTLGKSGDTQNLLLNQLQMQAKGADYYRTDRGGDITYHGPGQIVGYPIIDMEYFKVSVKSYIYQIEEAIILALKEYGIKTSRLQGATGVWLEPENAGRARKICAIGVKISRFVTMHGFAFNVNTNLDYFNYINPCGFTDKSVTSLAKELGSEQDIALARQRVKSAFARVFQMSFNELKNTEL